MTKNLTNSELEMVSGGGDSGSAKHVSFDPSDEAAILSRESDSSSAGGQGGNLAQNPSAGGPQSSVR